MNDVVCPHCGDAYLDCDGKELHCWKCGFSLTKEELKSKEALNMRKELTVEQVAEIKRLSGEGMKQKEIAGKVGISSSSVCKYLKVSAGEPFTGVSGIDREIMQLKSSNSKRITDRNPVLQNLEDEIIRRKVIIDKLTDEVNVLEKVLKLMEAP